MKKLGLFIGSALLCTLSFSQHTPKFGIKTGVNVANFKTNTAEEYDSRIGFHGALLSHIHLSREFALQPEIQYSQEGTKYNVNVNNSLNEVTTKLDYINLPIMLQYMFNNGFRLEAGPQFGFLINAKDDIEGIGETERKTFYKSTNVSVGLGANYLSYSGFGVGARYNFGLSDIWEQTTADIKSRNLQISVFYMLDNNHKAKSR